MDTPSIKRHELENGLILETTDESRQIAADRWLIRVRFKIAVGVAEHYGALQKDSVPSLDELVGTLGQTVTYEAVKERNFISTEEKDSVFDNILSTFNSDAAPYLGRPSFPGKLILKAFRDHKAIPPRASS